MVLTFKGRPPFHLFAGSAQIKWYPSGPLFQMVTDLGSGLAPRFCQGWFSVPRRPVAQPRWRAVPGSLRKWRLFLRKPAQPGSFERLLWPNLQSHQVGFYSADNFTRAKNLL